MRVKATIQVNGRPLRRAYVEHIVFGAGTEMYMTDLEGRVRDTNFDEGINSLTSNADIRVICQNPIVRVVDGTNFTIGVYRDVSITDGATVNLNTNAEQDDYYAILNRAELAYEVVFLPLSFFKNQPDPDFPLGRKSSLRDTRDQAKRIDLSYPDQFPTPRAFVEPRRLGDNFPLIHIKHRTSDGRLFGEAGSAPTLVPGELTHAIHFAFLTDAQRTNVQNEYVDFLIGDLVNGRPGTHNFTVRTTPEVAYIEAADWFSLLFMEFMRARQGGTSTLVRPEQITAAIQAEFVASEWARLTTPIIPPIPGIRPLPGGLVPPGGGGGGGPRPIPNLRLQRALLRRAAVTVGTPTPTVPDGDDMEGAVYAAIFVDFASAVGLDFAAGSYFAANAITFGQYRNFINNNHPDKAAALETARVFWGL